VLFSGTGFESNMLMAGDWEESMKRNASVAVRCVLFAILLFVTAISCGVAYFSQNEWGARIAIWVMSLLAVFLAWPLFFPRSAKEMNRDVYSEGDLLLLRDVVAVMLWSIALIITFGDFVLDPQAIVYKTPEGDVAVLAKPPLLVTQYPKMKEHRVVFFKGVETNASATSSNDPRVRITVAIIARGTLADTKAVQRFVDAAGTVDIESLIQERAEEAVHAAVVARLQTMTVADADACQRAGHTCVVKMGDTLGSIPVRIEQAVIWRVELTTEM
jgi:hypothetical protein